MAQSIEQTLGSDRFSGIARIGMGLGLGVFVTLALFWMMQYMIEMADRSLDDSASGQLIDFVRVKRDESTRRREVKPRKPPPPEPPPPEPPTPRLDDANASADKIAISAVPVDTEIDLTGGGFNIGNIGEGEYLPIVKVAPVYPQRAAQRGLEGYCVVRYTVTTTGTTRDPTVVADQCTSSMFHRASIQAALKFKYKPRVVNGEAVEVPNVRNKFTFVLED